tara:strand:- start:453 stop:686 length:234 start_codon:yes stop_codon:yes gene_type:complete
MQLIIERIMFLTNSQPKVYRNGYRMLCPAHDDRNPSFTISEGQSGKILMKCFRGCSIHDICLALDITIKDLFPIKTN